jgi:hypothetical protein
VLRADITVSKEDFRFDLPIEAVFLPSINAWWVVGPFDCPYAEGLTREFPPEKEIDLKATYEGKDGESIGWRQVKREIKPGTDLSDEFFVDFDEVFGGRKNEAVAYALTYLRAPRDLDAVLAMGTDDGTIVWLNGAEVHRYAEGRPYMSKQDRVPVKLRKGTNTLLLKVCQGGGDWGYGVHVENADGSPLVEVVAELEPRD